MWRVEVGDCRRVMADMPDGSVDSVVCDPPYELGFMGKSWDASGVAYDVGLWAEVLRLLKPGGHLLAFGGSRTYHRLACAVEDAGFEIRDQIMWVYGSGFPKSLDVAKAIDKSAGAVGEVVGERRFGRTSTGQGSGWNPNAVAATGRQEVRELVTDDAKRWEGWGTALKPAHEPIVVARKPLVGTVAANVLEYGTGGLNIDGCRVRRSDGDESRAGHRTATFGTQETSSGGDGSGGWSQNDAGRWPANLIHDGSDEVLALFPDTASTGNGGRSGVRRGGGDGNSVGLAGVKYAADGYNDGGSAARFFYCAKASRAERNHGLDEFASRGRVYNGKSSSPSGRALGSVEDKFSTAPQQNHHPTVKPVALMRYLVRLVTPPSGTVLDPFCGSGSTGKAAVLEGFSFVGIEQDAEYADIAKARIRHADERR